MGKLKKDHRKKIAKRNEAIKTTQKKYQKAQHDYLMEMIEKEKAAGKFNSTPINDPNYIVGAPLPVLTESQGPML